MSNLPEVDIDEEIQELNLTYLLLAQRLLKEDKLSGMFRLKFSEEMADLLLSLSTRQLTQLSRTNQVLCTFSLDNAAQLARVLFNERDHGLTQTHAAMLLASAAPTGALRKRGRDSKSSSDPESDDPKSAK